MSSSAVMHAVPSMTIHGDGLTHPSPIASISHPVTEAIGDEDSTAAMVLPVDRERGAGGDAAASAALVWPGDQRNPDRPRDGARAVPGQQRRSRSHASEPIPCRSHPLGGADAPSIFAMRSFGHLKVLAAANPHGKRRWVTPLARTAAIAKAG